MNAPIHMGNNKGTNIFILDSSFELIMSAGSESVKHGVVLQIALSSLVADGAIQGMIDQ